MRLLYSVVSFSSAAICSMEIDRRRSSPSAIASSFALATEDKPATAGSTARGPPMLAAQNFRLDNPEMKKPAKRREASRPAVVGAIMRPHEKPTMIIER